jgi:hypothetical protein
MHTRASADRRILILKIIVEQCGQQSAETNAVGMYSLSFFETIVNVVQDIFYDVKYV